jgi:hypothetical protein
MPQATHKHKADKRTERARKVGVYPGARFGYLTVIQRVSVKGAQNSRWRVECDCGKRESVPAFYLLRPKWPKRSCGCITYADANPFPRERGIWWMMMRRCYHPDHVGYPYYGAKGVIVCPEWHRDNPQGWANFIAFMGPAPSKDHTLDRVDPRGNYQPYQADGKTRQVRWATSEEQGRNKRSDWEGKPPT